MSTIFKTAKRKVNLGLPALLAVSRSNPELRPLRGRSAAPRTRPLGGGGLGATGLPSQLSQRGRGPVAVSVVRGAKG